MTPIRGLTTEIDGDRTGAGPRLRVLVVIHHLTVGGSQMAAIDLATGVRDRGHDVVVAGPPGVLVDLIRERGLRFEPLEADEPGRAVGRAVPGYLHLLRLTRAVRPDLVHSYELTPSVLTYLGAHLRDRVPMTMTVNSMAVPDFMPGSTPLQVCSPLIASEVRRRSGPVGVIEIPTDCRNQHPDFPGAAEFREELGIAADELAVVVVSRFARALKQEGLETAIRAAATLSPRHRMRLVLVGDGPAMPELRALAHATNTHAGREIVILAGERVDPRPAYAAADIALGMGGSILRAMAFGKPCVIQGEGGFFRILDPGSVREFRWRGFYGIGDGGTGEELLAEQLDLLLDDADLRAESAAFALDLVRGHYSLEHAVDVQLAWYRRVLLEHRRPRRLEITRLFTSIGGWFAKRAIRRPGGRAGVDYFNSPERIAPGIKAPVPDWFDPAQSTRTTSTASRRRSTGSAGQQPRERSAGRRRRRAPL